MYCNDCDLAINKPADWCCPKGDAKLVDYAIDLNEARELIKEMRDILEGVKYVCEKKLTKQGMIKVCELLGKTKDYA